MALFGDLEFARCLVEIERRLPRSGGQRVVLLFDALERGMRPLVVIELGQ